MHCHKSCTCPAKYWTAPAKQYSADFPIHFPLPVLKTSGWVKESVQEILPCTAMSRFGLVIDIRKAEQFKDLISD